MVKQYPYWFSRSFPIGIRISLGTWVRIAFHPSSWNISRCFPASLNRSCLVKFRSNGGGVSDAFLRCFLYFYWCSFCRRGPTNRSCVTLWRSRVSFGRGWISGSFGGCWMTPHWCFSLRWRCISKSRISWKFRRWKWFIRYWKWFEIDWKNKSQAHSNKSNGSNTNR